MIAIGDVETGPLGAFDHERRPTITFNPIFFSRLTGGRFGETHPNLSKFQSGSQAWRQFAEAYALDQEAALKSTTYGKFQLIGDLYARFGFKTVGEFVRYLSQSQLNQYEALLRFARVNRALPALRQHEWAEFERRYVGSGHNATRLAAAYPRAVAAIAASNNSLPPGQRELAPAQ